MSEGGPEDFCSNPDYVGYLVTIRDRFTLADIPYVSTGAYEFFNTNGRTLTTVQQGDQAAEMADFVSAARPGDVVTIEGISHPGPGGGYLPLIGYIDKGKMQDLLTAVVGVGATRNGFNSAAADSDGDPNSKGLPYALVGWSHPQENFGSEGSGAEASAGVAGQGSVVALSTTLRPDSSSQYRPMMTSPNPGVPGALDEIVLSQPDPTAWPLKGGALKALSWLGDTDPQLGPDPRNAYWTQDLDQAATNSIIAGLSAQTYPSGQSFTRTQFTAAKAALIQELRWVGNTRSYLDKLSQPFASNALGGWAEAQDIADTVYNDSTKSTAPVVMEWLQFTQLLIGFAGTPGQIISRAMQLGMWAYGAGADGGPSAAEIRTTADKVGTAFIVQAKTAQATSQNLGDVIVSDYAKLKEVGTYGGCNPGATGCPPGLAYSAADRRRASVDVYRGIELQAWVKLLPLGYPTFDLVPPYASGGGPEDPGAYTCNADTETPFEGFPAGAYTSFFRQWNPADSNAYNKNGLYEMYALSATNNGLSGKAPPSEILNRLFGPLSPSGDPQAGGLGMWLAAYVRMTSPGPWSRTSCRWGGL